MGCVEPVTELEEGEETAATRNAAEEATDTGKVAENEATATGNLKDFVSCVRTGDRLY